MDAKEYQAAAMRTANPALGFKMRLENAMLGLLGESGELCDLLKKARHQGHPLDIAKLREESSDIAWYVAQACSALNIGIDDLLQYATDGTHTLTPLDSDAMTHAAVQVAVMCGEFADRARQVIFDGYQPIPKSLEWYLGAIQSWLDHLCTTLDTTIEQVWEANIAKLRARYPDGFSAEASISRKDVER